MAIVRDPLQISIGGVYGDVGGTQGEIYCGVDSIQAQPNNVLQEANRIIYGDREKTYGKPSKNLDCIAKLWNAYLESMGDRELTNKDVAVMMVLLKSARLANAPEHRDSLIDICGYAALVERCDE